MSQLRALKQGVGKSKNRLAVLQKAKESEQRMKDILSMIASTGLTIATGGAGLPAMLSKIPQVAQVVDKVPKLASLVKFLDATQKTSRAGVYGANILNKMIHRGIGDLLIPDTIKDYDKKAQGYLSDIAGGTADWGKSWLPGSKHPWQSGSWEDAIAAAVPDNTTIPFRPGQGPGNEPTTLSYTGPWAADPRAKVSIPSKGGGMFATTPNTRKGLFGSSVTQKPSGYMPGGNPYYNLVNLIED